MILLKACPRCGGDVDTTYRDDVYCVQCAYRPTVVFPGPRIIERRPDDATDQGRSGEDRLTGGLRELGGGEMDVEVVCRRCGSNRVVGLEKLRPEDNTCYRCRPCGHIFSPSPENVQTLPDAAQS